MAKRFFANKNQKVFSRVDSALNSRVIRMSQDRGVKKPIVREGMKVSVIIPTRNGGKYLELLFKTLGEQTFRPVQILVVDSSSDDNTSAICHASDVDFLRIDAKTFDHGGTRNHAASKAKGEVLVFMTQDTYFRDVTGLENLIKPLQNPMVAGSFGRHIPTEDASPVEAFFRSFNYPSTPAIQGIDDLPRLGVKTFFFSNACSAIRKSAFEEVGGFPERTIMNEDMFLAAKLIMKNYKIAYQPKAAVYHSHNYSLRTQFKRYFDIGVFFYRNKWIKDIAKSEKEGIKYVREEIKFLFLNKHRAWVPYALADATARFLGYRVGLLERILPLSIKKLVSFNKSFWNMVSRLSDRQDLQC